MNQLTQFQNNPIRAVPHKGEPWLVATDVCHVLGIKNTSQAITRLHPDDLLTMEAIDSRGRTQRVNIVSESGPYDLILKSRKPEASVFRRWVTKEVLPSIHKNGFYSAEESVAAFYVQSLNALVIRSQKQPTWSNPIHGLVDGLIRS